MILLALAMAVTVEGLIEYIKTVGKAVLAKQWKTAATQGCALALGVTFALPWVGTLLTEIFASRGSNYVSDLVGRLQTLGKNNREA